MNILSYFKGLKFFGPKFYIVVCALIVFPLFQNFTSEKSLVDSRTKSTAVQITKNQNQLRVAALREAANSYHIIPLKKGTRCLDSKTAQACLYLKNPVFAQGSEYSAGLHQGMSLAGIQNIPLQWNKNSSSPDGNILENQLFRVYVQEQLKDPNDSRSKDSPILFATSNDRTLDYANDRDKHLVAQSMVYYALNEQVRKLNGRTGSYYLDVNKFTASQKKLRVNAYDATSTNNAYFDPVDQSLNFFPVKLKDSKGNLNNIEMAMSGEVVAHELAHANYFHAIGAKIDGFDALKNKNYLIIAGHCPNKLATSLSTHQKYCPGSIYDEIAIFDASDYQSIADSEYYEFINLGCSIQGCSFGLNEGQADIHTFLQYEESKSTVVGESIANNLKVGFDVIGGFSRNPKVTKGMKSIDFYAPLGRLRLLGLLSENFRLYPQTSDQAKLNVRIVNRQNSVPVTERFDTTLGALISRAEDDPINAKIYQHFYQDTHANGAYYASVLWEIKENSGMTSDEFANIFMRHLPLITHQSNVSTGLRAFVQINRKLNPIQPGAGPNKPGKYETKIVDIIKKRGITW